MRLSRVWLILLLAILCRLAWAAATPPAGYFPLVDGNFWDYTPKPTGDNPPSFPYDWTKVAGTASIGEVETYLVNDSLNDRWYLALAYSPDGILCYQMNELVLPTPQYFLKFPFTVGSYWILDDQAGPMKYTVLSTSETVTTSLATYTNCVKLKWEPSTGSTKDYKLVWLAPFVGMVRQDKYVGGALAKSAQLVRLDITILDRTPPSKPTVTIGERLMSSRTVNASWGSEDLDTEIVEYQAGVSTTTDASGILPGAGWRTFGTETQGEFTDLPLQEDKTYYVVVRAMNEAGLTSEVGASSSFGFGAVVDRVEVIPGNISLPVKGSQQFAAKLYTPDNFEITGKKIAWSCDANLGTISSSGKVTVGGKMGLYAGAVTVTVVGSQVSGKADVTVRPGDPYKVVVEPSSATKACAEEQQFTAKVADRYGNEIKELAFVWTVKKPDAGAFKQGEASMLIAGTKPGRYAGAVEAAYGKIKGTATVTVVAPPPSEVDIAPSFAVVEVGKSQKFVAIGYDSLIRPISGLKFAWAVSDVNLGRITSAGLLTAAKKPLIGFVQAQALIDRVAKGAIGIAEVQVIAGPPSKIVIQEPSLMLITGATQQFHAQVFDKYSNPLGVPVTWTITNAKAGQITSDGLFTASNAPGSYSYSVQAAVGRITGKAKVTVTSPP